MSQFIEMFGDPMTNTKAWVEFGYIGNYTQIVLGTTPNSKNSSYWNGEIKWITPAEMTEESYYIYDTERHLTEEGLKAANLTLLPCRSVLFSTRAPIGKVGLVGSPMYCNQGFKNFVCGDQLNPVYLYYSLIFKREYLVSLGTGTTFKELSKKAVENLKIAVPPLILQNKFEEIYQQADKSKFGDFKSQFIEMFGNPVTNTKGWKTAKIKDVAPEMPSKEQLSGKIWLLNLDMIESNTGRIIEKVYEDVENALSVQSFDEGNVLFSKLRPYLNKVVIPDEPGMATTELVPLRPEPSKLHKVFLSHMLRGNQFVNYANDIAGGTKMPRMPLTELRNFDCILPPMDKQLEFVFIAEQADKSKSVIQKALVYLNDIQSDELGKIA
ncbi:restriction endonuclease subunit S [Bacteroides fragilis]|mgnify:CR=1 FL=1|uniref:restriction endonuclease subunit S n=1 Tax=Bacteroides fragilis TaxID=817 RepID=UPI002030A8D0|nr:restriction endonuclease subunit S [Bacteroides fragilis]MCM0256502.1 restriction endonuclease subunit S [Bacteroides fragilis]